MKKLLTRIIALLLVTIVTAVTTWTVRTRAAAPASQPAAQDPVAGYLGVSAAEHDALVQHDPTFDDDLKRLRAAVDDARTTLAALLEKSDTSDNAIREQVEVVIKANTELQRRVMEHVLTIRDHLTPAQQQRLLNLCAQGIRQGPGWGWGRRSAIGGGPPDGIRSAHEGPGSGRGFRGGRGPTTKASE